MSLASFVEEEIESTPQEIEELKKVQLISQLEFENVSICQAVQKNNKRLHKKGSFLRKALWLGCYYGNELKSGYIPDVRLGWIDSAVGWGVFAKRPFKKGEFIGQYCGVVRKRRKEDRRNGYCFEYPLSEGVFASYVIDAQNRGGIARWINHSFRPNLATDLVILDFIPHILLSVNQPIAKGEQLFYDYGADYWSYRPNPKEL